MTEPEPRRDVDPDQAALDELLRAFGATVDDEVADVDEGEATGAFDVSEQIDDEVDGQDQVDDVVEDQDQIDDEVQIDDAPQESESPELSNSVISIADDDLPDAVYIEGSLDGDSSDSIVFIDDDDSLDTVATGSSRELRRGIEPRMRDRRLAVSRAEGRRKLWLIAGLSLVLLLAVGALAVLGSPLFSVSEKELSISGAVYTDEDALAAVVDDLVGTPVLLADTDAAERKLEQIPWVDEAQVRTHFPRGLTIEIREREAVATYQGQDGSFRVIDRSGRILDVIPGRPIAYMLLVTPEPVDLAAGQYAPIGYAAAAELVKNLTPTVRRVTVSVESTASGDSLKLHLESESGTATEVRFGEAKELFSKLVRLETVMAKITEGGISEVDVSTSEVTLTATGS